MSRGLLSLPPKSVTEGRLTAVKGVRGARLQAHTGSSAFIQVHFLFLFQRGPGGRLSQIAELRAKGAPHARPFRTPHGLRRGGQPDSRCPSFPRRCLQRTTH
jgi:hypothetical protein